MADESFQSIPYELLPADTKAALDANAKASGMKSGAEYLKSRGGVNRAGYYGDAYVEGRTLTDQEYIDALAKAKKEGRTGSAIGAEINMATQQKAVNYYLNNPSAIPNESLRNQYSSGQLTKSQLEQLLKAGYADARGLEALQAINTVKGGGTLKKAPVGVTPDGKLFYGYDAQGKPILDPDKATSSNATVVSTVKNSDGSSTVTYSDGTTKNFPAGTPVPTAALTMDAATAERKSAYDLLYQQFAKYGLQSLVTPLESLIKEGVPASEFAIRLRETDAYQKRFAANKSRINKGLAALSEAEYIGLEDQYQNIMRRYGMPESYYTRGEMGRQEGFEKLIGGDVSAAELETRVSSAYDRVINANQEVLQSLKSFYPNITNGDILAYVLDPEKALTDINKKITAAEIGGAALGAGLGIGMARAEELGAFGVTKAQAQQGYQTIADILPSATKLSDIYAKQGLGPYNQAVAEQEVFGISGAATAAQKRRKLTELETAQFSGQVGAAGGALARERAGQF